MTDRLPLAEVERQCAATRARPLRRLPESWWSLEVAAAMSEYVKRTRGQS